MSDATPEVRAVFFAALEQQSREDLEAYLDRACGGDAALRSRVEDLLRAHQHAGHFLGGSPSEEATADASRCNATCGTKIGPYKLLQQIGEGGMGVVYMAEQNEPVKRRVALKIIKPGMDSRQVIARFEAERQALAMMDHPNIAKVLEAGQTDGGRPYFVMELVNGIPLTDYCDEKRLTPQERIGLFISICKGIQHAHQKGIVHRDLKPSNVLVAEYDHEAVPKIIDFGVAKALSQSLTDKTMFTQFGQVVGTLEYMSPEQAKRNQLDVDTRTDIYSLGVILYELLTGDTPFDRQRLRTAALDELIRIIHNEEPPKPSTRLRSSATLPAVAANRRTEPARLSTLVRGDLDWIVMKALEKDRARRYDTAHELAADLQRYLGGDPVEARPPSTLYRLRKAVLRSRGVFATIATVSLTLLLAVVVSSVMAALAIEAQKTADHERAQAELHAETLAKRLFSADVGAAWRYLQENNADASAAHLSPYVAAQGASALPFDARFVWSQCKPQNLIEKRVQEHPNSLAFSHDGSRLAVTDIKGYVRVWDITDPRAMSCTLEIKCNHGPDEYGRDEWYYTPVAFSPTDDTLAFLDDNVRVVRLMIPGTSSHKLLAGHTDFVTAIAFSPDGTLVATASEDGTCRIWNVQNANIVRVFESVGDALWSVAFSPDGRSVAAGTNSGVIHIWQRESEQREVLNCTTMRSQESRYPEGGEFIWQLAYSPDGTQLAAACADTTIKLWDLTRREQRLLGGHTDQVRGVAFMEGGDMLVSSGRDGAIKVWRVADLQEIRTFPGLPGQRIAIHGSRVAAAAGERAFRIWSLTDVDGDDSYPIAEDLERYFAHNLAFAPDASKIAIHMGTVTNPTEVRLLDLKTRTISDNLFDTPISKMTMSRRGMLAALTRDQRVLGYDVTKDAPVPLISRQVELPASSLGFAADGSQLAVGRVDGHVEIWDTEAGLRISDQAVTSDQLFHVILSGDELIAATSNSLTIWSLSRKTALRRIPLGVPPLALPFSPESRRLLYSAPEGTIAIIDLDDPDGEPLYHAIADVNSLRFIDRGETLVTTNYHGRVGFWNADPFQHRMDIVQSPRRLTCSAVSPDGTILATGGQGHIRLFRADAE